MWVTDDPRCRIEAHFIDVSYTIKVLQDFKGKIANDRNEKFLCGLPRHGTKRVKQGFGYFGNLLDVPSVSLTQRKSMIGLLEATKRGDTILIATYSVASSFIRDCPPTRRGNNFVESSTQGSSLSLARFGSTTSAGPPAGALTNDSPSRFARVPLPYGKIYKRIRPRLWIGALRKILYRLHHALLMIILLS